MKTFEDSRKRFAVMVDTLTEAAVQSSDLDADLLTRTATSESQTLAELGQELRGMRSSLPNGLLVCAHDFEVLTEFARANRLEIEDVQHGIRTEEGTGRVHFLSCNSKNISSLEALCGLTALEHLVLDDNKLKDVSALSGIPSLKVLRLLENRIDDISALSGLTTLNSLGLSGNQIQDISAISCLTSLTALHLSQNQIQDLSPLAGLASLEELGLSHNRIQDISALAGLPSLKILNLRSNGIQDISALAAVASLSRLWIDRGPKTETDAATRFEDQLAALRDRGVKGDMF